ncbi:MAG: glycosyltransferase family 39 protein [Lachnospiraceae bacterium]|nr:glycosyltransferase family 39 protein [Lachnospiraceae bacterium]
MDRIYLGIHYISIVGGIILAAAGVYLFFRHKNGEKAYTRTSVTEGEVSRIAVLLLFLVALILRLYRLGDVPFGINQDEAMSVLNARALLETGKDLVGNSFPAEFVAWGNGGQSVLLGYSMLPLIALLGDGLAVIRIVPVFYSMLGLAAFYILTKKLLSARTALGITCLAAFSPWHFMQSRWALDCNLMGHLWILGILLLFLALEDRRWYYGAAVVFGLSMYSYGISFYTIPIFLVAGILLLFIRKQISWKQMVGCIAIYLLVSLPIDLTMLINTFRLETLSFAGITMPLLPEQVRSQDILLFAFSREQLRDNVQALLRLLLGQYDYFWFNSNLFFGTIYLCSLPFALIGFIKTAFETHCGKEKTSQSRWTLVWIYVLVSLFSGIITKQVNVNRMNFLYYGLLLLTGIGINTVFGEHKQWKTAVYGLYAVNILAFLFMYFTLWADTSSFFGDYEMAMTAAGETGKEHCAVVVEYDSPDMTKILTLYQQHVPIREYLDGTFDQQFVFYGDIEELDTTREDMSYVVRLADTAVFSESHKVDIYGAYAVVYQ